MLQSIKSSPKAIKSQHILTLRMRIQCWLSSEGYCRYNIYLDLNFINMHSSMYMYMYVQMLV